MLRLTRGSPIPASLPERNPPATTVPQPATRLHDRGQRPFHADPPPMQRHAERYTIVCSSRHGSVVGINMEH